MADILEQPEDNNTPIPRIKPLNAKALQADQVSVAVNRGLMGNPAEAAKRKEYSKELGVEPHEIGDLNEAKAAVIKKRSQMDRLIETNPGLARYLLNNPITPELASEDLPALHKIARAWRRIALDPIVQVFGKGSVAGTEMIVGALDIYSQYFPGVKQDIAKTLQDAGFDFKAGAELMESLLSPEQQLANKRLAEQETFTGALEAMAKNPSSATDMVLSSLGPMLAIAVLSRGIYKAAPAAGGATAAAAASGILGAGGIQAKAQQESKTGSTTPEQKGWAALGGMGMGALVPLSRMISNKLGVPDLDEYLATGAVKNALTASGTPVSIARAVIGGTFTEGALQEMPESVVEQFATNVATGKPWDEGLGAAAAQGLVAGSLTQAGFSPMMVSNARDQIEDNISRNRHKLAADNLKKTFDAMRAEGTRDMLAKVGDAVSESNLRNLSTDAFAEFVDHMTEDSDVDAVYIPVEKLDEVLLQSGMTESELTDKMPEVADNIRIARATKGDVRIPVKDYLVNFAGTPTEKSLLDHLKIDPEGMTFAESQEFMQSQQAEFAEQAQQIIAADEPVLSAEEYAKQPVEGKTYKQYLQEHPDQNAVIEADSKNVEKVIVGELNKAGRFNREANAVYAVPFREFFRTAAIRETRSTGRLVTPTEIYERYPLKYQMRGETPTATPDTLTQPVTAATPEDFKTENIQDILKNGNWMIVAATNPNDSALSDAENEKLHAKLLADLDARGLKYEEVYGRYGTDPKEMPSVLVYDVDNATARDFANRYDQDAVLVRDGFIYRDGQVKPHLGNVTTYSDTASAFSAGGYTRVPSTGAIFSVDFDWAANDRYTPSADFYAQPTIQKPGSMTLVGVHYSHEKRTVLDGTKYGTGLTGKERDRVLYGANTDGNIKTRVDFYTDTGNGVTPESGLGGVKHEVLLTDIYDASVNPLNLSYPPTWDGGNTFEQQVIANGYKGYFVNQGKQGRVVLLGEAARAVPVPTPEQLLAEKYQATQQYFQPVVSTRTPKPVAGRADPHLSSGLAVDLDALYASDNMTTKLAGIVNLYDGFIPSTGTDPQEVLESFINQVEQNLDWLYRQVPPEVVARSRQWYDGGRVIVDRLVDRYAGKYTPAQMAAALALLSPQTAWDKNVSLSERTVDIWTNQQDTEWSKDMSKTLKRLIDKIRKEEKPAVAKVKIAKLKAAEGFKLSELATDYARGVWIRVYDETYNPRGYRKLSPEGGFLDFALKSDGITIDPASWLSFTNIGKVVGVLRDASMPNISRKLGGNHKVRNFYNNLIAPSDPLSVTIDTHAVAAGHLLPLGSSSYEVKVALGSTVSSDPQGLSGSYVLYTEAYRRVAAKYGLLPRELQSIAWEALRGLFTPAFKARYQKDEALQAQFRELTEKLRIGETTHAEVAERIKDIAGGIQNPSWYGSGPRLDAGDPGSSYTGELLGARGSAGAIRSRARSGGPEGVPTLGLFEAVGLAAQQRAAAVNTNRPGGGTAAFFTKMTLGLDGKPGVSYRPVLPLGSEHVSFIQEYSKHRGNFDSHIRASIPGFGEVQVYTGQAIVDAYPEGANVLDIGASEGSWAKTITALSGSKIKTDSLEPLEAMAASFQNISTVEGARLLPQAFGDTGWVEEETGFVVEPFAPEGKYDVVHEAMTFQFIDKDRGEQIDRVKRYMSPDGIYLTEEKFANDGSAAYKEREALKDRYKARYFTSEAIADKAKEVLTVGMNDLMVEQQSLEATLKERFKYVVQYWSAANFGGYIASDSAAAVKNFLDKLPSTESEYSNQPPHRVVKGRLKLSEARKVSVTNLDDVLNQSSFYSALEREIGGLNKIANKDGVVKHDQAIKWIEARQKEGKFKKEEVEAVGVIDWIQWHADNFKPNVGLEVSAIEKFIRNNGVQLGVVFLGEERVDEDRIFKIAREDFATNFDVYESYEYRSMTDDAVFEVAQEMAEDAEHRLWGVLGENWHDIEGDFNVKVLAVHLQRELSFYEILGGDRADEIFDEAYEAAWDSDSDRYIEAAEERFRFEEGINPTEYENYQLDGGENYREILFRLPDTRGGFDSPHFQEHLASNLIAHTRVNERFAKTYTPEEQAQLDEFEKQYAEWVAGNNTQEIQDLLAAKNKSYEDLRNAANGRIITPELKAEDPVLAEAADRDRRLTAEVKALQETRRALEPKRPTLEAKKERVLFVEEVQSDWAQQGRDYGFILKNPPKLTAEELEYEAIIARISSSENSDQNRLAGKPPTKEEQERLEELRARNVDKSYNKKTKPEIAAAPFVTDTQAWVTLVTKRLLRYAAENGFTRISWTTGAQQADRYRGALLAQVDEVRYSKNKYGTYSFELYKNGYPSTQRIWEENVSADRIMAVFGKDIGEKIVNGPVTEGDNKNVIAADDLTVGGSGMKDFYDKLLPSVVSKVTKSLGGSGKVELIDFTGKGEVYDDKIGVQQSIAITPDMVERIMSGLPLFKGERGSFNPNTFITTLTDGSDKSTVIHEGGHFYLEALADMAAQPDAPQQVKDDFRKTLDWFGIKGDALEEVWASMTLEQKRPFHEQWAQSFERYIMEGKAPTVEMQPVFARFRAWMVSVYKSIKEFLKQNPLAGKLNDDVRAIFDRLLATEEKIAEMERARSMMPLFASADQAGVTQAKFEAYLAEGQAATDEAISQLAARSLRDMKWASGARDKALRQLQREAKAKRKALTEEVAAEVAQEPITQARNFLLRGIITGDDGVKTKASTTFKLDRGAINELYPGIDLTRIEKMVSDAGMSPDAAAQMFGFSSGQELVDALLNEESTTDKIQGLVDQRMLERYGDLVDDKAIEAAADKAIHNRVRAKFLATGLAMLKGQPGTAKDLNKAARLAAEGALSAKKVRDITPGQYAAAERRSNAEAIKRAAENPQSAIEAQRAALLNNHMARIARDIREEVEAGLRYVKKFDKKELRKLLGPDYVEQIDDLLSGFDFRKGTSLAQIDKMQSLRDWIEDQEAEGLDPAIDLDLVEALKTKSYKEMTIEEFRSLIDAVKQIEHLGRLKNKLLTAKEQKDFRATVDEAEQSIRDNANRTVTERETPSDVLGKVGKWVRQMFASHRKFNSVVREMDGFKNAGVMWRILARPMNEAGDREVEMRQQAAEQIAKLFGMLEKKDTVPGNLYSKKRLVPGTNISMTQEQRIMFGMNWGNEGNRQRLMDGGLTGRRALSAQEAQAILDTITKEEWDFIQGVLDYIGSYKDQIAALEKQLTGIEPKWIEASPIVTKFGTYRGGYFPAKYDADLSTRSEVLEAVNDLRMGMKGAFGSAATKNGYTKERSKQVIGRPILLSFNVISQHVSEVTHRLAWQPWLIDANRLLRALDEPIREHYGTEILRELRNTVLDIATGDVGAKNAMEAAINHLRTGSTIVGMGWRVTTALLQPSGLAQSWTRLGSRWATAGVARYLKNPLEAGRFVDEKSSLMRNRGITMQREINEVLNTLRSGDKVSAVTGSYFTMIGKMQRTVDIPTWIGAYEKHLHELGYEAAEGEDERQRMENEAIAIADQTVIDTQSGGQIKDLAGIQRGSPVQKLFTNFYSYFSATYNLNVETVRRTDLRDPASVGLMAVDLLLLNAAPVLFAVALKNMMKGGCDWGDTECLVDKVAQEQISFLMGQMVVLREVAVAGQAVIGGDAYGYQGPAGLRFFSDLYKLGTQVEQGDADFAAFKAANSVAGALFHYPAGQINSTLDGILAIEDGRVEGVSILPALIAGAPKE